MGPIYKVMRLLIFPYFKVELDNFGPQLGDMGVEWDRMGVKSQKHSKYTFVNF